MVVLCCILVVTGFLPSPISRSSLSSPPSQVFSISMIYFVHYNIIFCIIIPYELYNFIENIIFQFNSI